ncbi:MAG: universal stress protein, partial [Acidimicrobiia bacterium]|nr:universal stress protein [Acidimicrobiia bacterium]
AQLEDVTVVSIDDGEIDSEAVFASARSGLGGVPAVDVVLGPDGDPAGPILERAADSGAQLIVLGTRGLSPIRRLFAGSTAASVVSRSPVSVLLAHAD